MASVDELARLIGPDWRVQARMRMLGITERLADRTDVLLFGAGPLGLSAAHDLAASPFRPVAFVDNNPGLWGTHIEGLPVFPPTSAAQHYGKDAIWLITIYTNSKVISQCRQLHVPWVTCAELSWVLPDPRPATFSFGTPELLAKSADEIVEAASVWGDEDFTVEYAAQVRWRFLLDYSALRPPMAVEELYFPRDLAKSLEREVFVDCGAFDGDTIEEFRASRPGHSDLLIAIEPDPNNIAALRERIATWDDSARESVKIKPVALGAHRGTVRFDPTGTAASSAGSGPSLVPVAPLDELLDGTPPTYIKMDLEGAERDALVGGTETIRANKPFLAVCLYHKPGDLWDLPLLIKSIEPSYRLAMRRYSDERWETICYAVPASRVG